MNFSDRAGQTFGLLSIGVVALLMSAATLTFTGVL